MTDRPLIDHQRSTAARLSFDDLAVSADISREQLEKLVAVGLVSPEDDGRFNQSAVARTRLVLSLMVSGVPFDDLAQAVADERLSFSYVDQLMPEPVVLVKPSSEDEEALRWEPVLAPILGTSRTPERPVRADDLRLFRMTSRAVGLGIPPDRVVRIVRSFAQVASRLVDMQREFVDEVLLAPAIAETGSPLKALEMTAATRYEYRRLGRELIVELMDRQIDDAVFRNLVQLTEFALAESGVMSSGADDGIAFIDISEYSRLSESLGDDAAAVQASRLADLIQDVARERGARLVKSLGDGALVHGDRACQALDVALDAVASAEDHGIWPLHAGVNAGQVVQRDGDLFGSAVNIASRIAERAKPGDVVVSRAVLEVIGDDPSLQVTPGGEVHLKNISAPVELFEIRRL